jgi:sugar O-acyltransferase (sialic acid O-acetyltransferase NeuD family)
MKRRILIVGAGGLGRQFKHFIDNYSEDIVVGFLDDTIKENVEIENVKVLGDIKSIQKFSGFFDEVIVGIGYNHLNFKNELIFHYKQLGFVLYTYIHPTAYVDNTAKLGDNVFIYPNCTVDQKVILNDGVLLNNNVVVSHDCNIGDSSYLAPSVTLSGKVKIGSNCFIGSGTTIRDEIEVTNDCFIGAGSLILKNIDHKGSYVGGPILRKLNN